MKHRNADMVERKIVRGRRPGSVLALVAVSLVALVSVIALAIDIGMLYSGRTEAQRVADAAALAGASAFIDVDPIKHPAEATDLADERALDYATRGQLLNTPVVAGEVQTQIVLDSQRVRVYITRPAVQLIFARVFGVQTSGVRAMATAEAVYAGTSSCVKPFAIPDMWVGPGAGEDIYAYPGAAPIWDFDAHLRPNDLVMNSGKCSGNGQNLKCPREAWSVESASYSSREYGWGSSARDGVPNFEGKSYTGDVGRRLPLKLNEPGSSGQGQGTKDPEQSIPSWWYSWRLPGSSGTSDLTKSIKECTKVSVGDIAEQVKSENGNTPEPIWKAFKQLLDADPGAYWDEDTHTVKGSVAGDNVKASPRVITVAVVDPTTIRSGSNNMKFVDFATFFLEDPREVYDKSEVGKNQPTHMLPITGRLMKYGSGDVGTEQGSLFKRLRLVQ